MKIKLACYLNEESSDESFESLEEFNALGAGAVVGYTGPLGAAGVGSSNALEKGFWRDESGKKVKTASPALHKKKKNKSLQEFIEYLFEFEPNTDRGMKRLWADLPDVKNPEQPIKTNSPELHINSEEH